MLFLCIWPSYFLSLLANFQGSLILNGMEWNEEKERIFHNIAEIIVNEPIK